MRILLAIALVCGLAVAQADAAEYKAATFIGPKHPIAKGGWAPYFKEVEKQSGGSIKFRQFLAGSLLEAKALLGGVRDGVADAAQVVFTYHPAEFPHAQLVADFALYGGDAMVAAAAVTEFNLFHCAPCLAEFKRNGIVYTGAFSTTPYVLMSKVKIAALAELKGKKMRTPGSVWDRWATHVGGTPVNLPANEMFEGLSRGILDIAIQAPAALKSYNLADTAKYLTSLRLGTYHSVAMLAFNPRVGRNSRPRSARFCSTVCRSRSSARSSNITRQTRRRSRRPSRSGSLSSSRNKTCLTISRPSRRPTGPSSSTSRRANTALPIPVRSLPGCSRSTASGTRC
jgi:TRAP-type transport system periplasmic protein